MTSFLKASTVLAATALLAGCGGSGEVGQSTIRFESFSSIEADDALILFDGQIVAVEFTEDASGAVTITSIGGPIPAELDFEIQDGFPENVVIRGDGVGETFGTAAGGEGFLLIDNATNESIFLVFDNSAQSDLALFRDPAFEGFDYQSYGVWLSGLGTGSGTAGVGSFGNRTSGSAMPSSGTANYSGTSAGIVRFAVGGETLFITESDITISTDFNNVQIDSTGTVRTEVDRFGGSTTPFPDLDFSGSGSVSDSTFEAGIVGGTTPGTSLSGTANGQFYGPNAEEVGGTFQANVAFTGSDDAQYIGAFGAN